MRVLIGCERSGRVRDAFIRRGHDAWSCDLEPTDSPGPHIQGDVLDVLDGGWDLGIFHPVCRYLSNSGAKHLYERMRKEYGCYTDRWEKMIDGAVFFRTLLHAPIEKIAVENPVIHGHAKKIIGMEQTQIIHPWEHGHKEMKATCLWLKNLPEIVDTDNVGPPPTDPEERKKWAVVHRMPPGPERERLRSQTYQGIADAFADQWGGELAVRVT